MSAPRCTDEEIAALLEEVARGAPMATVCATAQVSVRTFYRWKRKFAGLPPAGVRRLKALAAENRELRRLLAERGGLPAVPVAGERQATPRPPAKADLKAREMHGLAIGRFATVRLPQRS